MAANVENQRALDLRLLDKVLPWLHGHLQVSPGALHLDCT